MNSANKIFASLSLFALLLTACGPKVYDLPIEAFVPTLTTSELEDSLRLGTEFLLTHQTEAGNFDYEYNFTTAAFTEDDNAVRQAGALWGLTLINLNAPTPALEAAIEKGLAYFKANSITVDNKRCINYPDGEDGKTGTQALVTLSVIDYLRANPESSVKDDLDAYLNCLTGLRQENGQFYGNYEEADPEDLGEGYGRPSAYYDGEALLALIKAVKYAGYEDLGTIAAESAEQMYKTNVQAALTADPDSDTTKGFYQWGSMAFYELYTSDWSDKDQADWILEMAVWMVDTHEVLGKTKNTAYAFEGLISAYETARLTGDAELQNKLLMVVDTGLDKLLNWQITNSADPLANGGIKNEAEGETLRIDVAQHQMHATILALKFIY